MRHAIKIHLKDFLFIIGIALVALVVGGFILSNQRLYLPKWVPGLGTEFVEYKADMQTAKALAPGQGQTVTIAGVPVGEIGEVELKGGRAVVTLKIRKKYANLYKDVTALTRPKTGLEDMTIELHPGTADAGELPAGGTIPASQTAPTVTLDEVLSSLDKDTRDYLVLLAGGGGEALAGNEKALSASLRRFQPTTRDVAKILRLLEKRRENVRRVSHNFRLVAEAIGEKDQQFASLVRASDQVFAAFAKQDAALRESISELPISLKDTKNALAKLDTLATDLGPTLEELRPGARALESTSKASQEFFKETTPVIENQLRPFARDIQPTAKSTQKAAADLSVVAPALDRSLQLVNELINGLAYNPPGKAEEGYLFWASWLSHSGASVLSMQDGNGVVRRGLGLAECGAIFSLQNAFREGNPLLAAISDLTNLPKASASGTVC
ncbi:MAG: MCE family protein [Solirubrobacteraceae bacterium]|nr:MCE family protein [Solirubrobacteraceae bacterium]